MTEAIVPDATEPTLRETDVPPARTAVKAGRRRDDILQRAAELFAAKGVAATTVRDIGDAAGILSGSLYHHFSSKEKMVEEIVLTFLQDLMASYDEVARQHDDARARVEHLIEASFTALDQNPHACEIYQNDYTHLRSLPLFERLRPMAEAVQRYWLDAIELGVAQGTFRSDIDPGMFYRFARDAIWFTVRWRRRPRGPAGVRRLSRACSAILLDGYVAH